MILVACGSWVAIVPVRAAVDRAGDIIGCHALEPGAYRVDPQIERIAGELDAALYLHHAVDLADGSGDFLGLRDQGSTGRWRRA